MRSHSTSYARYRGPAPSTMWRPSFKPYERLCDGFGVHVDVLDCVRPSVGFELLYDGEAKDVQPDRERRWIALFDRLVAEGLCLDRERDALLRWASQRTFTAPLIERLIAGAFPSDRTLLDGTLYTGLQHIKLSLGRNRAVLAKAYFGAALQPPA